MNDDERKKQMEWLVERHKRDRIRIEGLEMVIAELRKDVVRWQIEWRKRIRKTLKKRHKDAR